MGPEKLEISAHMEPKKRKTPTPEGFVPITVAAKLIGRSPQVLLREGNAMDDIEFTSVRTSPNGKRVLIFINEKHLAVIGERLNPSYTPKNQNNPT